MNLITKQKQTHRQKTNLGLPKGKGRGFGSIPFSRSVVSNSLWPHGLQHARPPCPSPTPWACSNSCPSSQWCHPTISPSVNPFSSCLQSFPTSGSFPMSQFFASGSQSIGVSPSTSVLTMNIHDWLPLGLTGLILMQFKGLSRVFSNTTVQKHQFFSAQLSLWSNSHISHVHLLVCRSRTVASWPAYRFLRRQARQSSPTLTCIFSSTWLLEKP